MKKTRDIQSLFVRYGIILLVAIPNLWVFYFVFTPLTVYPVFFIIKFFFNSSISGNIITVSDSLSIEIIKACVAGSAYYLLLILNLSTPGIKLRKRLIILALAFISLLIMNILRILLLGSFFVLNAPFFDFTHKLFWYMISTVFVVGIWFTEVKLFRIKEIPIYSDLIYLYNQSYLKR